MRDHKTVEIYDRSQGNRERERQKVTRLYRDDRSQGSMYIYIYIEREITRH